MTPKEKAKELIDRMLDVAYNHDCYGSEYLVAKDAALIAVDEVVAADWYIPTSEDFEKWTSYWQQVKQEIEKL